MAKISTLGWIGIAAGALLLLDVIGHVEEQVQAYGNNPEEQKRIDQEFQQGSDQAKQQILQNLNQ